MHKILTFFPLYYPMGRCDTIDGPCACGAWHKPTEMLSKIECKYGNEGLRIALEILEEEKHKKELIDDEEYWFDGEQGLL